MRKAAIVINVGLVAVGLLVTVAPPALSQTLAAPSGATQAAKVDARSLAFDVISIKRNKTGRGFGIQSAQNGDSITITDASPRLIIGFAYNIPQHDEVYGLPDWADSEAYDVVAKVTETDLPAFRKLLPRERNPMLQLLLADRFHLKVHFETRTLPAYALVVAKNGPRLRAIEPAVAANGRKEPGGIRVGRDEMTGEGALMANLQDALSRELGRPVVDRTGLTGHYSFTLKFAPVQPSASPGSRDDGSDSSPSIFTAVQEQLGLKLESTKAPVQVLVVDHIEPPTAN